jgi:hypothetical protein
MAGHAGLRAGLGRIIPKGRGCDNDAGGRGKLKRAAGDPDRPSQLEVLRVYLRNRLSNGKAMRPLPSSTSEPGSGIVVGGHGPSS